MTTGPRELDVAIVGGGLGGNLLARQLRLAQPELSVGLFEKATAPSAKVGEALVEIASNYLIRRLRLSSYLYEKQLPKNGLRYFFDTPGRDAPLEQMSEIGSINLPFHPAFQLDRTSLEGDLLAMNRADGVHVRLGARVGSPEISQDEAPHRFEVEDDSGRSEYLARWLVDAAGRGGFLAKSLGLRVEEEKHRIGSVWGRFEDVVDIDAIGSPEFGERVRHAPRRLSTIHFWYPGYWIWFIPLRGGLTSVGLTGEIVAKRRELRTADGFRSFLEEHRAIADLLKGAKQVDVGSLARIAYGTKRYFSAHRWGLVGEAASAADPLYSPGSDFIALENDYLTDLITRDFAGEGREALAKRTRLYDRFMRFRQEATMLLYSGLYDTMADYELGRAKWDFDIALYYNLWVTPYMRDQHLDAEHLTRQLRLRPFILQAMRNFGELFARVARQIEERGEYGRLNTGQFYYGLNHIDFVERVGTDRSEEEVMDTTLQIFNEVRAQAHVLLGEAGSKDAVEPLPMNGFLGRHTPL